METQRPPLYVIPEQAIPFNQVQELFFSRILADGTSDQVTRIEVYFRDGLITGLAFVYQSNHRQGLGLMTTGDCQSIQIPQKHRFTRFSATVVAHTLAELKVYI